MVTRPTSETERPRSLWIRPSQRWRAVLYGFVQRVRQTQLTQLAAAISFFAILAIVPALFALWSLVGLYLEPSAAEQALRTLLPALPARSNQMLLQQLKEISAHSPGSLSTGLWFSMLATLWGASSGMGGLVLGLRTAVGLGPGAFVKQRALALGLTFGALIFVTFLLVVIVATPFLLRAAEMDFLLPWYDAYARWPLLLLAWLTGVETIYQAALKPVARVTRLLTPGSVFAVAAALLGTVGFTYYADRWGKWEAMYGTLAGVVILLLWLYGVALALLLGASLNAHLTQLLEEPSPRA